MTTIALRNGILAVDSRVFSNGRNYGSSVKLGRSKDGWWAAGCGVMAEIAMFHEWARTRNLGRLRAWKCGGDWKESGMVLLAPDGGYYFFEGYKPIRIETDFVADGSGDHYAMGAMAKGASAIEAVKIAARYDPATGGPISFVTPGALEPIVLNEKAHENHQQAQSATPNPGGLIPRQLLQRRRPLFSDGAYRQPADSDAQAAARRRD